MSKTVQKARFTFAEWVTLIWFGIDAFTHLSIELGYVCLALTTTAAKSDSYLGHIWREYGRADARWAIRDANVISIEIATVLVGILCLFQIYGVIKRSSWRHVLQVIICVAELYGGWMTFAPGNIDRVLLRVVCEITFADLHLYINSAHVRPTVHFDVYIRMG